MDMRHPAAVVALLSALLPATALTASMRTWITPQSGRITLGATMQLHVEVNGNIGGRQPLNLRLLTADFTIGQSTGRYQLINGKAISRWQIALTPKRTGKLQIAPLSYGPLRSQAITIEVTPPPSEYRRGNNGPALAWLETGLERERSPVEAQLVYAVRLIHRGDFALLRSNPPPFPDNMQMRKLGRRNGRNSDGKPYIEERYALFPQRSGTLQLDAPTAHVRDQHRNQVVVLSGKAASAEITPRPATAQLWLPALSVKINDQWGIDDPNIEVGESLSRSLVLSAEGLLAEQLPELSIPEVAGLRRYPEADQLENSVNPHSVVGQRHQRSKLIPIRAGRLVVPELRVPWWNVESEQWEEAVVPERVLWVSATPSAVPDNTEDDGQKQAASSSGEAVGAPQSDAEIPPWQRSAPRGGSALQLAVATGSSALMLLFAGLWLRELSRRQRFQWGALKRHQRRGEREHKRLMRLRASCERNNAQEILDALREWCRHHPAWGGGTLSGLRRYSAAIDAALGDLERQLYAADVATDSEVWRGAKLWQAVEALRHTASTKNDKRPPAGALPALYPENQSA